MLVLPAGLVSPNAQGTHWSRVLPVEKVPAGHILQGSDGFSPPAECGQRRADTRVSSQSKPAISNCLLHPTFAESWLCCSSPVAQASCHQASPAATHLQTLGSRRTDPVPLRCLAPTGQSDRPGESAGTAPCWLSPQRWCSRKDRASTPPCLHPWSRSQPGTGCRCCPCCWSSQTLPGRDGVGIEGRQWRCVSAVAG